MTDSGVLTEFKNLIEPNLIRFYCGTRRESKAFFETGKTANRTSVGNSIRTPYDRVVRMFAPENEHKSGPVQTIYRKGNSVTKRAAEGYASVAVVELREDPVEFSDSRGLWRP